MSIEGVIQEEAGEIAAREHQRAAHLQQEYLQIQSQADELKAQRDAARAAPERLANFRVKIGGNYQCPACWIMRNTSSPLITKPSDRREDVFECNFCRHTIIITY